MNMTKTKKALIGAFFFLSFFGSIYYTYTKGVQHGLTAYHQMCYQVGGILIHPDDGTVVVCGGQGQLPKEELNQYKKDNSL